MDEMGRTEESERENSLENEEITQISRGSQCGRYYSLIAINLLFIHISMKSHKV